MPWTAVVSVAVAFAAGLAVGIASAARRQARVRRIREGIDELASGNLGHRILMPGSDDAARAAEALNELAEQVQLERETSRQRDTAQRRLLANISHDLRTPITSIAGYIDAIRRGLGDDPGRYLSIVAAKTDELAELTDDLFYEARLESGDLQLKASSLDLAEATRRALLGFEPQFTARGVDVQIRIPDDMCTIRADASAVARVLDNIISNALRHSDHMTVFSATVDRRQDAVAVVLAADGDSLTLDPDRLFERGVSGGGGGAGLGLAIARELADRMGARIAAAPGSLGGTAFTVTFPLEFSES